ncbi:ankyrin repeat-containing domain protein [Aspergillus karnatakaensis]|uniref:ankyrin repeat domain-containing protein n=1 Tax=Aspergillus karnatakaensis TaxID=1810916 RepID=UPI003CCDA70F
MQLALLPTELLLIVWNEVESIRDKAALVQTCRRLNEIVDELLYRNVNSTHFYKYIQSSLFYGTPARAMGKFLQAGLDPLGTSHGLSHLIYFTIVHERNDTLKPLVDSSVDVKQGIDPLFRGPGESLLWLAIEGFNGPFVEMLLQHGASPNVESGNGISGLEHAVETGQWGVVQMLIQAGVSVATKSSHGPILDVVAAHGPVEVFKLMRDLLPNQGVDTARENLLRLAVRNGNREVAQLLFAERVDPRSKQAIALAASAGDKILRVGSVEDRPCKRTKPYARRPEMEVSDEAGCRV